MVRQYKSKMVSGGQGQRELERVKGGLCLAVDVDRMRERDLSQPELTIFSDFLTFFRKVEE